LAVYVQTNTMVFSNTDTDTDVGIANTDQQIPKVLNCFSDLSYLIFMIITAIFLKRSSFTTTYKIDGIESTAYALHANIKSCASHL